jgi:DNA-binding CsgD family transcriptional regulator
MFPEHAWIRDCYLQAAASPPDDKAEWMRHRADALFDCAALWWCRGVGEVALCASRSGLLPLVWLQRFDPALLPPPVPVPSVHDVRVDGAVHTLAFFREHRGFSDTEHARVAVTAGHLLGAARVAELCGAPASAPAPTTTATERLSQRELQIAERVARGLTFKEIAVQLDLAQSTVSTHVYNLYHKLGVHRRSQLIQWLAAHPARA